MSLKKPVQMASPKTSTKVSSRETRPKHPAWPKNWGQMFVDSLNRGVMRDDR